MSRLIQTLLMSAAGFSLLVTPALTAEVRWHQNLTAAFRIAEQTNRPVLIHFWTPQCGPCRRLEQNVFNQPQVARTLEDFFVPVKVNANEYPELAERYQVNSVPKDVIVTAQDVELHRLFTPQDADQYVAQLTAVSFRAGSAPSNQHSSVARSNSSLPPMDRPALASQTQVPSQTSRWDRQPETSAGAPTQPARRMASYDPEPREVINRYARQNASPDVAPPQQDVRREPAEQSIAASPTSPPPSSRWGQWNGDELSEPPMNSTEESVSPRSQTPRVPAREVASRPSPADLGPSVASRGVLERRSEPSRPERNITPTPAARQQSVPLGMDGFCPVTLLTQNKWLKGDPRYGVIHRGRTYLFRGQAEKETFFADPDEYSPVLAGVDPVSLSDDGTPLEGNRAHGVVYRKRVYLFSSETNLEWFWENPERYAGPIRQAMESNDVNRLFR